MPNLIRTPWTSQPQVATGVDVGNSLTNGLVLLSSGDVNLNARGPSLITPVNGASAGVDRRGKRYNLVRASSQYLDAGTSPQLDITGDITLLCWYVMDSIAANYCLIGKDNNTGGRAYTLDINQGAAQGVRFYVNGGGSDGVNSTVEGRLPVTNDDRLIIAKRSTARNQTAIWADGVQMVSTTASTATPVATTSLRIGARSYSGFTDNLSGAVRMAAVWNRYLLDAEIRQISANPWQLFAPLPRRIWAPAAAGGGAFTPTITESASATDTASQIAAFAAAITEAATAADTSSNITAFAAARTEAATAADSCSCVVGYACTATETATAADTVTEVTGFACTATEAATATDTSSNVTAFAATITEAASAADTASSSGAYLAAITESASATDTESAVTAYSATITESGTAADTVSSSTPGNFSVSITESASAADTSSNVTAFSAAVAEAGSAADTPSAVTAKAASISEPASAADLSSAVTAYLAAISEAASATATQNGVINGADPFSYGNPHVSHEAWRPHVWHDAQRPRVWHEPVQ